ncbi:MAG TPA: DUF6390 family protein [Trebonia sp.]|nr:DUF6390 family protein [Trebonia sp.]
MPDLPSGARLFARYAYAPNHLGHCGPADSAALFELAATGRTSADVAAIASRFTGAWPYLCVLAAGGPGPALDVLDNCRIRWGRVRAVRDDRAVVRVSRLTWDGQVLRLGADTEEEVRLAQDGAGFAAGAKAGDWLAVHWNWNWACDRLNAEELGQLRAVTGWQLDATNVRLARENGPLRR